MQFGGAQPSEPVRVSKSTSKRVNELLHFADAIINIVALLLLAILA